MGQILTAGQGQKSRPPGLDQRRYPDRGPGLGHQPALWLGPARGRPRRAADHGRLLQDRRRRRPGEHEPVAALFAHARGHQDGRRQVHRHDDQGRPLGRLQRLPHGYHGRERRAPVPDHPAEQDAFAVASQNKAEAARKAGRFKDEIAPVTIRAARVTWSSTPTSTSRMASRSRASPSCGRVRPQGGRRHRRQRISDGAAAGRGHHRPTVRVAETPSIFSRTSCPVFLQQNSSLSRCCGMFIGTPATTSKRLALWTGVAAIEMALLELMGQTAQRPLADFLAEAKRRDIPVYFASSNRGNRPEEIEHLRKLVAGSGVRALKFRLGGRTEPQCRFAASAPRRSFGWSARRLART